MVVVAQVDRTEEIVHVHLANNRNGMLNVVARFSVLAMYVTAAQLVGPPLQKLRPSAVISSS